VLNIVLDLAIYITGKDRYFCSGEVYSLVVEINNIKTHSMGNYRAGKEKREYYGGGKVLLSYLRRHLSEDLQLRE
jgi:hypothetical protein